MKLTYKAKYVDKVSMETTEFLAKTAHLFSNATDAITGAMAFTKRRLRHYGLLNKYLPPDFKKQEKQNGCNEQGHSRETQEPVQS